MKKLYIVLLALILIVSGCGTQSENESKATNKPKTAQDAATSISEATSSPADKPAEINTELSIEEQISQLLPNGTYNASVLKRVYVYPSAEDEELEQKLEKELRNTIEKRWKELTKKKDPADNKSLYEIMYNKNVPFRDNYDSFLKNMGVSLGYDIGWSIEKYDGFIALYNSAKEEIIKDYNTPLTIKKEGSRIEIALDNNLQFLKKGVTIDFSNKTLKLGNATFEQVGNKEAQGFSNFEFFIHEAYYDKKEIGTKCLWAQFVDTNNFNFFIVSKVGDTNRIILRYIILNLGMNKYTEEMILI